MKTSNEKTSQASREVHTDLNATATRDISEALNVTLADVFSLYMKTKNFHWHMSGPHFRDYHLMLDEQATQIYGVTDDIAERVRKIGGRTVHSIGEIARLQRIKDNDADFVAPLDMLAELRDDNQRLAANLRETSQPVRSPRRCRQRQHDRNLDRRSRAPRLVPVRIHPRLGPANPALTAPPRRAALASRPERAHPDARLIFLEPL